MPIEPVMPASLSASVNARDVYWAPASEWCSSPWAVNSMLVRRRVNKACSNADSTSGVVLLVVTRQPRIRREYTSVTNDT